ncbi:conjugal transfer protein [Streptococcus cuniculi]|uniref:Conjugal transfer protein n=1 Tax=Streptococcus cuniculi TaxID=1432788 RepID=A0A4Y9JBF9_9STRE|nr:conjugal transfer protein [Streptococcus cuniculi]MBF0777879.1 conjugal transfer protein [Streptococcus cuniculi]TFU98177.1 conjugal transfer protein [Streptococcus cuniculi]
MKAKMGFLPKLKKKKQKNEMKLISQKKMNLYFVGGFFGIVLLCVLTVFVAFSKVARLSDPAPKTEQVALKTDDVDNRLRLFLESYISSYFNFSGERTAEETETLNSYYNFAPETKLQATNKIPTTLLSSKLVQIKDNIAVYRVYYEVGLTEKDTQKITVLFGIPYGGSDGQYYVAGLPFFRAVENLKAQEVDKKQQLQLNAIDDVSQSDRDALRTFLLLFFKNYTTSQDNLNVIAKDVKSLNGAQFKSIDYTFFKIEEGNKVTAYVQATLEIAGTVHAENYTFSIVKKDDGSFYVEKLEYVIPSGYAK